MDNKDYTCFVSWSEDDNQYVGLCKEFPSLSWLDSDKSKALDGIKVLLNSIIVNMLENNEKLPEPIVM